ncbi:MAG: MTH938/NDUFAF3 family protein [Desulfatiglandaceae bacterium]
MLTNRIDTCAFGAIFINGKRYTEDLIILPDGEIRKPWRRKRGHGLTTDDLRALIDAAPEVIVIGTGVSGGVKPDKNLESDLAELAIDFFEASNEKAIKIFNQLTATRRVAAGFHLTC